MDQHTTGRIGLRVLAALLVERRPGRGVRGVTFPHAVVAVGWGCADAAREGEQLRPASDADLARVDWEAGIVHVEPVPS